MALPFAFKPSVSTTAVTKSGLGSGSPSLFSFSKFGNPSPPPAGIPSIFGSGTFSLAGQKSSAISQTSIEPIALIKPDEKGESQAENDEDKPEAFEPNVEFTPCVEKLPELVNQTTGEEEERVLFCQRARLFRWDKPVESPASGSGTQAGEWKARGVGELKILADDKAGRFRIVMRRDQVRTYVPIFALL